MNTFKHGLTIAVFLGLLFSGWDLVPAAETTAKDSVKWYESYAEAVKAAKQGNKPILADFNGSDWCGWCIKLKKEVFNKSEFRQWAKKNVILLDLDFPRRKAQAAVIKEQNRKLMQKYGVQGFPTILFLESDGKLLGQSGYLPGGPKAWIKQAQATIGSRPKPAVSDPAADKKNPTAKKQDKTLLTYNGQWLENFETAKAIAAKKKLPLLLDFTGSDWCGWCIRLHNEVFSKKKFKDYAKKKIVLVKLDFPRQKELPAATKRQNGQLAQQYDIRGFPTIIVLDSAGQHLGTMGYMAGGPEVFLKKLKEIVK